MSEQKSTLKEADAPDLQEGAPKGAPKAKKIRLNIIDTAKLPAVISIFGVEHFKLNSCLARNASLNICKTNIKGAAALEAAPEAKPATATTAPEATPEAKPDAADSKPDATPAPEDSIVLELSEYFGKNAEILTEVPSYVYKTRKEFERLYLPSSLKKEEKKLMIKVFRFIFSKDATDSILEKLLTPFDKVPCKEGTQKTLWELFKQCIEYRIYGDTEGDTHSIGLNKEIPSLQGIVPKSEEVIGKQYLRAQLLRMAHILQEDGRTCVVFSGKGGEINLNEYHTSILDLLRKTVKRLLEEGIPLTEEQKTEDFTTLLADLKALKPVKDDNRKIYDDMIVVVKGVFDKLTTLEDDFTAKDKSFAKLGQLIEQLSPRVQAGGAVDVDAEAEEEYERVFTTAMEHIEAKPRRTQLLEDVCEVLGGTSLESAIEHAVTRKGFSLPVVIARLEQIDVPDQHGKSFLRCVQTLLEIKEEQYKAFEVPHLPAGEKRYAHTLSKYPFLKQYIPEDLFRAKKAVFDREIRSVEKKIRRVYPYTDFILEDIDIMRKSPDPCCLFYKGVLTEVPAKARKGCKKIVDSIPKCKEMVEELLDLLSKETTGKLTYKEVRLPKGFSLLAEAIRSNLPKIPPTLPMTIHESPGEFAAVLGDSPFLLLGDGTILHGIKGMEIDVTDEIDDLRKGEISIAQLMFLYLFIKCDSHIDV